MLPWSDGVPARRFPVVSILLIVANFAAFIVYELPNMNSAVYHASFYPCTVDGASRGRSREGSAGSPACSCLGAGTTSWATCSSQGRAAHRLSIR